MLLLATSGLGEGVWLRAERQTAGRGRQGRHWVSPVGNLYASTLVHLRPDDPWAPGLALLAGVALARAVDGLAPELGSSLMLKWPNDLLLGRAKLAGILLERVADTVVVGIGANVAHRPDLPDRPTTSLAEHGVVLAPSALLSFLAGEFADLLDRWRRDGPGPIRSAWLARAHARGTALALHDIGGDRLEGTFEGLDESGALRLRLATGHCRVIHAGDVFLL